TIQITVVAPPVPAAPVIVSPTNNATGVTIHPLVVSWETVAAPVTHYQLQGTEDGTFMDIHVDTIVADTFFVAHDAPHDRELHVRVRAVNVGGEGPWTAITFRTIEAPPSISYDPDTVNYPLAIAITPLEVTADPDSGPATSFSITPELPAGLDFDTETGAITGTPTAVTEATDYTVIASGPGGFDTTLVRIAVIPVAPGVVTNVEATTGVSQASVAFTAPVFDGGAAITSYTVTSHPGNITASGPTSPIVVAGLTATVPYTFTVTATNSAGTGVASDTSGPVAPYNVPGAPLTVTGLAGNTQVTVSWAAPESDSGSVITGYTVTSNPEGKTCSTSGAVTTQCIVTGLTNGTAYTFSVTATNAAGTGAESAPSAAITPTPDPTAPSAPLNVAGTPGNGEVVVTWDAPLTDGDSEITGYTVTATPGGATCAWTTGELTCTVTGLTNGTAYTFAVIATNAIGSSQPATSAGVTPRTVPGVATNVVATAGALQASVAFTAPDGNGGSPITSYTVTAHPGGQTATGPASPINVTGLTAGTDYRFTVVATNAAGNGAASDTSDAVTPYTVPDAPTAIAATPGNAQATVTFTAPAGDGGSAITGYKVTAHPGGITATEGASPVVVTGLTNGTTYTFTVRAINAAGEGAASDTSAAVTPNAPPVIAYTPSTLSFPALAAVTPVTPASTGGPVTSWSVTPDLPAGLSLNTENGAISGTPTTVVAAADYKVIAHGALGKDSVTLNIAVTANPPVIAYNPGTVNFTRGQAITPPALASTGGPVTTWSIAPALPAGLTFNTETGAFSGTPTAVSAAADYTVTASNSTGSATATVNITVLPGLPVIAYSGSPKSFIKGVADSLLVTSTGGAVASYSIAPALPAGLTLNTTTGRIAGTPTGASAAANYTVTATNASGTATATVNITVVDMTPVISYAFTTLSFTRGQAITNLTPVSTGGSVTAYAAEPALPGGITLNATTGVISGNPTAASAAANYRIIASNAYGKDTVTLNITVLPGLPVIAYSGSPKTFIKGVADSLLVNSTGGVVASYAVAPALPAGLTLNTTTGRIAGTPTGASAAANYTVTATNASGTATATVNITVVDLTPVVSYTALTDSFTVGIAVTKNATSTGGAVTEWTVTPALPAGLALNGTTGSITGTPTTPSAAANYTVIAKNAYGADTLVLNLKVLQSTAIMGGAYTFRVSGVEKPYAFVLPAGAATTEKVTMLITDVTGRTVWTKAVRPNTNGTATEVVWTGRTSSGMLASAGMYVVRISVLDNGKTTEYVRKSVTLKSR
ncbi:MAG TPA: putative Ig domain-containing protein, partial [Fibrobacteria bacterium]|nr:putative Ig domain-containing protein [Fibrobacteria bacterium]